MDIRVELSEKEIREAVYFYIKANMGIEVPMEAIKIQVKSKQNYKSEWEEAAFRAHFTATKGI